ncbi:O-antigen ligase family protein [Acidovorax soli]|uniref:O-antigen ligase family protein n=1 Tax=Acidovorax soli TaxID=592050 RepID=UPI0032B2DCA4
MKNNIIVVAIYFLTGVFATAPILTVSLGGKLVSIFSILFVFFYAASLWFAFESKRNINAGSVSLAFAGWYILSLIASLAGIMYFGSDSLWVSQVISYVPKILIYLTLLLCIMRWHNKDYALTAFFKGFFCGCIANLTWSVIEGLYFYIFNDALNDILFVEYVKTLSDDRGYMTVVADGIIRASGFNTDPAHLGVIIPIVFAYALFRRNWYLIALSLTSLVFSGSTTAAVTSMLVTMVSLGKFGLKQINLKSVGIALIGIFVVMTGLLMNDFMRESVFKNAQGFYNRATENYVSNSDQGPRYIYHAYFLEAIYFNGFKTLTGSGFGTASHPYVDNPEISVNLDEEHRPYDPESTYISYLFDTGFLGLVFYMFVLISSIIFYRRRVHIGFTEVVIYSSLCGMFFSGFFYHYTLTAYQILILTFSVAGRENFLLFKNS